MVWTNPRTWVAFETLSAVLMNLHLRDNLNALAQRVIAFGIGDVAGPVITTGVKGYLPVPFPGTITAWDLIADAVGDIVIDVWKDTWANAPPTVADTIAGTEKPTLSAEQKAQDTSLSSWDPDIAAGDVLGFNVDSVATVKQVTVILRVTQA